MVGGAWAQELISSDRFVLKILDRTISLDDITYQQRNLKALDCIYSDAMVVSYFEKSFITDLGQFLNKFPKAEDDIKVYLHAHDPILKKIRLFLKMLRYSEDQNTKVSAALSTLIREGARDNNCGAQVLYKNTLKTNFISLMQQELYLRSRYGQQLKASKKGFETIRSSLDLFVDSLDKQFGHEYFW